VINDWGTSYICAKELGQKAMCLIDLGHHLPNTNIEMIVSRLIDLKKLGGFHFNDSQYGDDDLDSGSINPHQLFLIFNELTEERNIENFNKINYMIDQSHNLTDPIESLIQSTNEILVAYAKSLLVDKAKLESLQNDNDIIGASNLLKVAFNTDVYSLLKQIRLENHNAINPIFTYRKLNYKNEKAKERKNLKTPSPGII
jgi:L-rhamnose isomerase/sugar isomerase